MGKELAAYLEECRSICNEYRRSKESLHKDAFNVFHLVSDLYYRENFHSDIICFFLDPHEKHNCGDAFLRTFIQMLNNKDKSINPNEYHDAKSVREQGKIDILIKSESSKRAIIIENKINDAVDMDRQIPRYYDKVSKDYSIDAIVYLPLSDNKTPDMFGWSDEDKKNVYRLLVTIPAYDKSGKTNLVDNWLRPCIMLSDNLDVVSTLRQYSQLITKLNQDIMDTIVLEKFYNELLQDDNLETAQSIRDMLIQSNGIPGYMANRIKDEYKQNCSPFDKVWIHSNNDAVFGEVVINGIGLKIDIWCSDAGYEVRVNARDKDKEEDFVQLVQSIKALNGFEKKEKLNWVVKFFGFSDEKGLFDFLDQVLSELRQIAKES